MPPGSAHNGPAPLPSNSATADTFGLVYGQLIRKTVDVPYADPAATREVKFLTPIGGFVDLVNPTPNGICQVCHTETTDAADKLTPRFRNTGVALGSGDIHSQFVAGTTFGGTSTCSACHEHIVGFRSNGHTESDFGWAPITYTTAAGTLETVNCATCHDSSLSIVANIHGNKCVLCHVNFGGGGALRVAGSTGVDAVDPGNGIDGDPSGTTKSATCAICHDKAIRPAIDNTIPLIHHAATSGNHASLGDCTYCHQSAGMESTPLTQAADHSTISGAECTVCHTATAGTAAGMPVSPTDNRVHDTCVTCHDTNGLLLSVAAANKAGTPATVTEMVAGNCAGCHGDNLSADHCLTCHSVAQDNGDDRPTGGRRPVVVEFPASNAHAHYGATLNSQACLVCHDMATHKDGYVDLVDADNGGIYHFERPETLVTDPDVSSFCQSCHDADGATRLASPLDPFGNGNPAPDIKTKFQGTLQWNEWYGDYCYGAEGTMRAVNSHHDISTADQSFSGAKIECLSCHGVHIASQSAPLANPNSTNAVWAGTYNDFCLSCHNGGTGAADPGFPTGVTGPAIALRGLESCGYGAEPWYVDFTWANGAHGEQSKRSWTGYSGAPSYVLSCKDCHDPHGSYTPTNTPGNPYMIRDVVDGSSYVDDGVRTGPLWTGPPWTTYGDTRAVKITISGVNVGWGGTEGLCNVCHASWREAMWAHTDCGGCQTCHGHGQSFGEHDWGGGKNSTPCP